MPYVISFFIALVLVGIAPRRALAGVRVDLELVLAVGSSASIDNREFELQVRGMSQAFRDAAPIEAIQDGHFRRIAAPVVEWASEDLKIFNIPCMLIEEPEPAHRLGTALGAMGRNIKTGATPVSGALLFAANLLPKNGFRGIRQVIDLSCHGRNNQGAEVHLVRDLSVARGITINGLTIPNEHPTLNLYFEQRIIAGSGAFTKIGGDYHACSSTICRKLIKEITNISVSGLPAHGIGPRFSGFVEREGVGVR